MNDREQIEAAASQFPAEFGLRAFPGKRFRIGLQSSYVSDSGVQLYTQVRNGENWQDFAKGTASELRRAVARGETMAKETTKEAARPAHKPCGGHFELISEPPVEDGETNEDYAVVTKLADSTYNVKLRGKPLRTVVLNTLWSAFGYSESDLRAMAIEVAETDGETDCSVDCEDQYTPGACQQCWKR